MEQLTGLCKWCGKEFNYIRRGDSYKHKQSCSQECRYKHHAEMMTGRGDGYYLKDGYKFIPSPNHPSCNGNGYVREHRLVMEEHLGRYLEKTEVVHHKNGDRLDNSIKNLEIVTASNHARIHMPKGTIRSSHIFLPKSAEFRKKVSETMKRVRKERFWSSGKRVHPEIIG